MKIEWHPLARYDLAEMLLYIAEDNAEAAYRLQDHIEQQVAMLSRMPEMGRSERRRGTREMVIAGTSYVAAYRVLSIDSRSCACSMALDAGRNECDSAQQFLQSGFVNHMHA